MERSNAVNSHMYIIFTPLTHDKSYFQWYYINYMLVMKVRFLKMCQLRFDIVVSLVPGFNLYFYFPPRFLSSSDLDLIVFWLVFRMHLLELSEKLINLTKIWIQNFSINAVLKCWPKQTVHICCSLIARIAFNLDKSSSIFSPQTTPKIKWFSSI